jgi:hypothetical protein
VFPQRERELRRRGLDGWFRLNCWAILGIWRRRPEKSIGDNEPDNALAGGPSLRWVATTRNLLARINNFWTLARGGYSERHVLVILAAKQGASRCLSTQSVGASVPHPRSLAGARRFWAAGQSVICQAFCQHIYCISTLYMVSIYIFHALLYIHSHDYTHSLDWDCGIFLVNIF